MLNINAQNFIAVELEYAGGGCRVKKANSKNAETKSLSDNPQATRRDFYHIVRK